MSPKKRFEKIEIDHTKFDKKSFLDKLQFRRKLEIKGSPREKLSVHNFKGIQLDPKRRAQSGAQSKVQSKVQSKEQNKEQSIAFSKAAEVDLIEQKTVKHSILESNIPASEILTPEILKQNNHKKNPIQIPILNLLDNKWRHEKSTVFFFGLVLILSSLALSVQLNKSFGLVGFRFADILYVLFLIAVIISSGYKILKKP